MALMQRRMVVSGLAVGPAVGFALSPVTWMGGPILAGVAAAASVYALVDSIKLTDLVSDTRAQSAKLLRPGALRAAPQLPNSGEMRQRLTRRVAPPPDTAHPGAPMRYDHAVARVLRHAMRGWEVTQIDLLTVDELTELFLLDRLLDTSPGEAGEMADLFRKPDSVLSLRDAVRKLAEERAEFDRQHALYDATCRMWRRTGDIQPKLAESLRQLHSRDADLWHRVVLEHDPDDPDQRRAAFWCLQNRDCDRATVASYCALAAHDGRLLKAVRQGEMETFSMLARLLDAWNRGYYQQQELALDPADLVAHAGPEFAKMLDDLARITGAPRLPDPTHMFTDYHGRRPHPRKSWCLKTGRQIRMPDPSEYMSMKVSLENAA